MAEALRIQYGGSVKPDNAAVVLSPKEGVPAHALGDRGGGPADRGSRFIPSSPALRLGGAPARPGPRSGGGQLISPHH